MITKAARVVVFAIVASMLCMPVHSYVSTYETRFGKDSGVVLTASSRTSPILNPQQPAPVPEPSLPASPATAQSAASQGTVEVRSYKDMYNAVKKAMQSMKTVLNMKFTGYKASTGDIVNAVNEVIKDFPELGYCYEQMSCRVEGWGSSLTANVTFRYKRTKDQLSKLKYVKNYKEFYETLKSSLKAYDDKLAVKITNYDPKTYDFMNTIQTISFDYPDIGYGCKQVRFQAYGQGKDKVFELELSYVFTKAAMKAMDKETGDKAKKIAVQLIKPGMRDYEKELVLHDYIVNNAKYDSKNYENGTIPEEDYTLYGILVKGIGVCEGYARAMKKLMDLAGVECKVITGYGKGEAHAWNLIKIQGDYYHLDVTWDDPVSKSGKDLLSYKYFNLTDSEMNKDHQWDAAKYPKCTSGEFNYENVKKLMEK